MATSESDLRDQLADLDWGTGAGATQAPTPATGVVAAPAVPEAEQADSTRSSASDDALGALDSLDVGVAGVSPPKPRKTRGGRAPRIVRGPNAQALLDAARDGQTVDANAPDKVPGSRRGRNTAPDVLTQAGESPAVVALFDAMWKDTGSKLARGIGRPKASRQDAAIGWYALLLAMRERDAKK